MQVIEKANEIVKQIVELDTEAIKIERLLEGITINRKKHEKKLASLLDRIQCLRWKGIDKLNKAGLCQSTQGLTDQEFDKICESSVELKVELKTDGWHYFGNGEWC